MLRVIYSIGLDEFSKDVGIESYYKKLSNEDYEFILFDHRQYLGCVIKNAQELDYLYWNNDKSLYRTYGDLKKLIDKFKADILVVSTDNIYHPEFIKKLDIYKVLASTDDPNASYMRTVPYLWSFDHVTCVNVIYHKDMPVRMTDKLIEWGAKRATWCPIGAAETVYNPNLTEEDILNKERDIDILHVGGPYREKRDYLLKIKKVFGKKFKMYGKWGLKVGGYYLLRGKWIWVKPLSMKLFVSTYQNSKIGINMHQSGELGNGRLYQLPANGVMQICDCKDILETVFEPDREIVGFNTIDEAIELIKYYLEHDDERKKIAVAGFRRVMKDYKYPDVQYKMLKEIKKGMLEKGVKHSRDGTSIELDNN